MGEVRFAQKERSLNVCRPILPVRRFRTGARKATSRIVQPRGIDVTGDPAKTEQLVARSPEPKLIRLVT